MERASSRKTNQTGPTDTRERIKFGLFKINMGVDDDDDDDVDDDVYDDNCCVCV